MAGKAFKEGILVKYYSAKTSDGQFGNNAGTESILYNVKAKVTERNAAPLETDTRRVQNSQTFTFLCDPSKVITAKHWVEWRGKRCDIYSVEYSDSRRIVTLRTTS